MGTEAQRSALAERCAAQFDSDSGLTVASWPGSKSLHHKSPELLLLGTLRIVVVAIVTTWKRYM